MCGISLTVESVTGNQTIYMNSTDFSKKSGHQNYTRSLLMDTKRILVEVQQILMEVYVYYDTPFESNSLKAPFRESFSDNEMCFITTASEVLPVIHIPICTASPASLKDRPYKFSTEDKIMKQFF